MKKLYKLFICTFLVFGIFNATALANNEETSKENPAITGLIEPEIVEINEIDLPLSEQPEVILEAKNLIGEALAGASVIVRDLSDSKNVVFRGVSDDFGQSKFTSILSKEYSNKSESNVIDLVYEAYIISKDGTLTRTVFSVPHVKDASQEVANDLKILEKSREKNVVIKQETAAFLSTPSNNNEIDIQTSSVDSLNSSSNCVPLADGYIKCLIDSYTLSSPTKIASINVASGEYVDFSLSSSAKVSLQAGVKRNNGAFSTSGSVNITADTGTTVDYDFSGTCAYFGSTLSCNNTRNVYAEYSFLYEKFEIMRYGVLQWTDVTVTPTGLSGSSSTYSFSTNANNGRPVSNVTSNQYGQKFDIFKTSSTSSGTGTTTKSYTEEKSFSGGISVPTPAGTFSGTVTTAYKNSHSIKWYLPNISSTKYWHYDYGTGGKEWYVTY